VLVSVGARQMTGCIVETDVAAPSRVDVRDLDAVLDEEPFLPAPVLELALWTADYYAAGPGDTIAAALPPLASIESERRISITADGRARLEAPAAQEERGASTIVLHALATGASFSVRELAARVAEPGALTYTLRTLAKEGLVSFARELKGRASGFRHSRIAALTAAGHDVLDEASAPAGSVDVPAPGAVLGERQRAALDVLRGAHAGLDTRVLRERGVGSDTIRRLVGRGLVALRTERRERDPFGAGAGPEASDVPSGPRVLTAEQEAALARLLPRIEAASFHVALVHGVTGSGKTELYLRLAAATVQQGRQVLMLVPEIALTPAVATAFRREFGPGVAIQHSALSDGERHDQWHRIRSGEIAVVVGTRSAVFAPLERTGLVIVDEEHDASYKQEETPRYNGRDVAIVRARQQQALAVLGSATPSLESYRNASENRYELIALERRVLDRPLAHVRVVNMRDELAAQGPDVVLSSTLAEALEARLARGEQSMLLLNRRGFARAVFCRQCGATLECPNCSVSLTVHHERSGSRARCHYCNHSVAVPKACTACAAPYVEHIGFGTARVEAEVAKLLPGARIARVDRDAVQRRGAIQAVLAGVADRKIDVIVGTQMIAKGHDFPSVTLVGVISADVGLGLPDFRAAERTFQLLTQVAGRAGRGEIAGEAVVQTLFPEHYSIQLACRQDYRAFYAQEIRFRRAMRYPPAVSLVNVIVRGRTFGEAMNGGTDLAAALRQRNPNDVFRVQGPAPAPLGRIRGEFRVQVLLKSASRAAMRQAIRDALAANPTVQRRATVDVDPLSLM
jgi:primosomal protein N' (replication factor Y) (superfamily II helicase)